MTKHLISMGHKKIGGIFKLDDGQGRLRYSGYVEAMSDAGLPIDDSRIIWIDTEDSHNLELLEIKIMRRLKGCTGVFCYNDQVAFRLIDIFKNNNINVPTDISVVGVDNSDLSLISEVPITSIPHPMELLGQKAAENLLQLMKNPEFDATYEFAVDIVQRQSVAVARK